MAEILLKVETENRKTENTGKDATQREKCKRKLLNESKSRLINKCSGENN